MPILTFPPYLRDSAGSLANGEIVARVTNQFTSGGDIILPMRGHWVVDAGIAAYPGNRGPAVLPVLPVGFALELVVRLQERDTTGGNVYTDMRRVVTYPDVAEVTWEDLEDVVPAVPPSEYVVPPWAGELLAAKPEILAARDQAQAAQWAAEAVGNTNDTIIAGRINDPASATTTALANTYVPAQPLGLSLPAATTHAAVQSAADSAATFGTRLWAAGTITTNQTLVIKSSADLSGLTINYTGSGVAVQVGDTAGVTLRLTVSLPRVIAANKTVTGWAEVVGTVGVLAVNLNSCSQINVPYISNFETGLKVYGQGQGNSYNTLLIGHLANNKVNLLLDASATGWSNQNTYIGGRYGHNSGEGASVTGARHVAMVAGLANPINNNVWINSSFEGDTPEFNLDVAGSANLFLSCRYETTGGARVRWQADAVANVIRDGYKADAIVQTRITGATRNHILSSQFWQVPMGLDVRLENTASSANAALTVLPAGATSTGVVPSTGYCVQVAANLTRFKRTGDSFDRVQVDSQNSKVFFGTGTAAAVRWIGNKASSAIAIGGGDFVPDADNTLDNGLTSLRWRYVRAGTAVSTGVFATGSRPAAATAGAGAMVFDSTLGKPIWSDGTNWKDATGTTV